MPDCLVTDVNRFQINTNYIMRFHQQKKGPEAAAINFGFQVGISQVSIGTAGLRKIYLSGNVPAHSTKGMQKSFCQQS